jgi:predicted component of type VI protein secretion system
MADYTAISNARYADVLRRLARDWQGITPVEREALDAAIAALSGDPTLDVKAERMFRERFPKAKVDWADFSPELRESWRKYASKATP